MSTPPFITTPPSHILLATVRTTDRSPALAGMPAPYHRLTVSVFHLEWAGEDLDQVHRVAHHRHRVQETGRALSTVSTAVARIRREYVPAYHDMYAVPGHSMVQEVVPGAHGRLVDHPAVSAWDHLLDLHRDLYLQTYYGQDGVDLSAAITTHHPALPVLMAWTVDQSGMYGVDPRPEPGQVLGTGLLDPYVVEHG